MTPGSQISEHCLMNRTTNGDKNTSVNRLFQIYRSEQNGWVYNVDGVSPTITVGCHSGVAPMIIEYDER